MQQQSIATFSPATPHLSQSLLSFDASGRHGSSALSDEIKKFRQFGKATRELTISFETGKDEALSVPGFVNEFWTARQRQAHSLHEVSYRACFKPQLPRFFIERLTQPGEVVYDPFMGRGTTLLEAALLGRVAYGCDVNPLSLRMIRPRLAPPSLEEVRERLQQIDFTAGTDFPEELLVFYHRQTLEQLVSLRRYLLERERTGAADGVDGWICLVALNRLTGHSPGFFSV